VKRVERRRSASRLPDLRELAPRLRNLAQRGKSVPLLYVEFRSVQAPRSGSTRARLAACKQATAAALKAAIGSILREGDVAAAGAGGKWFIVLLAGRAKPASSHSLDADLGVAAERLRCTVQRELARMRFPQTDAGRGELDVRCGWNVLEPSADPLEALRHAVRGAALVARIEERRAMILAAITHEVRTPLTAIMGFAERLREDGLNAQARRRSLDVIVDESRRLQRLAEGLIDMGSWNAQGLRLDRRRMRLAEIATRACEALAERAAACDVALVLKGDAVAHVDPDRCLQILINLLDNAIRHSPRGGRVTIRISQQGSGTKVCIEDQGRGFERDVIAELATPFKRGKGGKIGLGLAIARLLATAHGGSLVLPRSRSGGMVAVTFSDAKARRAKNSAGPNTRL
jgi:signal transduction histidine kinase